jgi:hypothetical protein
MLKLATVDAPIKHPRRQGRGSGRFGGLGFSNGIGCQKLTWAISEL